MCRADWPAEPIQDNSLFEKKLDSCLQRPKHHHYMSRISRGRVCGILRETCGQRTEGVRFSIYRDAILSFDVVICYRYHFFCVLAFSTPNLTAHPRLVLTKRSWLISFFSFPRFSKSVRLPKCNTCVCFQL